jgi:hypothetical protein
MSISTHANGAIESGKLLKLLSENEKQFTSAAFPNCVPRNLRVPWDNAKGSARFMRLLRNLFYIWKKYYFILFKKNLVLN